MNVLTLPKSSKTFVAVCLVTQAIATERVIAFGRGNAWPWLPAFLIGGFITDLISGFFHFSFDYVWPPRTPIMGPIAVEFQEHHVEPTLDPCALATNLTKGAYGAFPLALLTLCVQWLAPSTTASLVIVATLLMTSLWMLGFHQIHAYAHMGSELSSEDFNRAVSVISKLPAQERSRRFAQLFANLGIPRWVRVLQRARLFLRPEVHWQHHISFETDFSSVNGWSDPLTNLFFRPLARWLRARRSAGAPV